MEETKVNTKREMLTCVAQNLYGRQSSACSATKALKSRCHSSCTRLKHRDHYVQNEGVFIHSLLQLLRMCFLLCQCLLEGLHLHNGEIFHSHLPPNLRSTIQIYSYGYNTDLWHSRSSLPHTSETKAIVLHHERRLRQNKALQQRTLREYL